jgi:hypothetical protein
VGAVCRGVGQSWPNAKQANPWEGRLSDHLNCPEAKSQPAAKIASLPSNGSPPDTSRAKVRMTSYCSTRAFSVVISLGIRVAEVAQGGLTASSTERRSARPRPRSYPDTLIAGCHRETHSGPPLCWSRSGTWRLLATAEVDPSGPSRRPVPLPRSRRSLGSAVDSLAALQHCYKGSDLAGSRIRFFYRANPVQYGVAVGTGQRREECGRSWGLVQCLL